MFDLIKFYMDEHIPRAVSEGLRRRGFDVLTTQEAGMLGAFDCDHLKLAAAQQRVILTCDADFLRMHAAGEPHHGIVFLPSSSPIGGTIRDLLVLGDILTPEDMVGHVEFL